ncbi:TatD DNase family protein [Marinilabilia salmonicolor]|jgi:TatD DNase family protein|uniref:Qat anti-phage system TatD family nuclease QatD n=1 Tax=Marinilabilia salmonicolor TaxID=989 RepID=UPI000D04F3C2|nr:Qat anti-phage system TatD family nuclease QatD [Marinilabilia salmonicolor]PRY91905.1 TatD DNase family protein [Marinilabilia salmonicolor]
MDSYLYDTHFHLDLFKSVSDIVKEVEENKIYTIAVSNLPVLYSKLKEKISSKYIRPALGFHPELLFQYKHHIPQMWTLLNETRYIGEVGLDFKTGKDFKELQVSFFTELIDRCNQIGGKILTIHSRQSADEITSIIGASFNGKVILHWYSGSKITLNQAIKNGYFFSVNYSMVKSNSGKELIKMIPLDKLLLETDSPFVKYNKKPFTPKDIRYIVEELSVIFEVDFLRMSSILWSNFKRLIK